MFHKMAPKLYLTSVGLLIMLSLLSLSSAGEVGGSGEGEGSGGGETTGGVSGSKPKPTCNVNPLWICDGRYDCPDKSDEMGCNCSVDKFKCDCYETGCPSRYGCISQVWRCDGWNQCGDWSDEKGCTCPDYKFKCDCYETGCLLESGCITYNQRCNGRNDCSDWSDEKGCTCPDDMFKCDCHETGCLLGSGCITQNQRCNGHHDCIDLSDEKGCPCPDDMFKCDCYETGCLLQGCMEQNQRCDGWNNCGDWSDEKGCTCPDYKFKCDCYETGCSSLSGCITQHQRCNGWNDCSDWSDEKGCRCPDDMFKCDCYEAGCLSQLGCIQQDKRCDLSNDCGDWSDEKGCNCPADMFKCDCYETGCLSQSGCIQQYKQCDGWNDCTDWSDERNCQCSDTKFQCKDGDCIDRSKVNDENTDCANGDDEFMCDMSQNVVKCGCNYNDDECISSGRCIPNTWIGDTIPDCENHDDEPCNASKVWCDECWVVINQCSTNQSKNVLLQSSFENTTRCHSLTIQPNQTHMSEFSWICITSSCGKCLDMFQCDSGQFIDNQRYCDNTKQCNDFSDEDKKQFGFRCSGKSRKNNCVLPQKNVYDSLAQCQDNSDLCFVNGEFRCFSCLDGKLIVSAKQVCDGIVDCYDMSDECLCANQSVCNAVLGEEMSRCPINQMHCHNDTDCVDMDKVLCNSLVSCENERYRMFCQQKQQTIKYLTCSARGNDSLMITIIAVQCDGRPECGRMEDECQCKPRPSFCEGQCATNYLWRRYGNFVCDGRVQSFDFESLPCRQQQEKDCPMRFYCKNNDMISIDKRSVCDGIIDCDDHSDENSTDCSNERFFCTSQNVVSIDKAFVCDGIKDCDNGEDEARQLCGESASLFSDQFEMISNPILRALFWIMGLLALSGNMFINFHTVKDVILRRNNNAVKLANDILILNLTISDFLMGVYLISVVAQGMKYSGSYSLVDKKWRSSNLCSVFGTLATLSSETSAFIMVVMSTFRLVTVYNPFSSKFIKIKWIVISVCFCWIFSLFIAAIPWFPFDSGYFISDVWFPNFIFKSSTVSKRDMFTLTKRVSGDNYNSKSWFKVKEIISDAFNYNPIKGGFGYYGETSVCMPRFYASTNQAAWEYSTFLITLNFLLFIYMLVAYVLVYKMANGMKNSKFAKKDPNKGMQKRISRLLLTDFCCWIPVCIMGYLSVAGVSLPPDAYVVSAGFLLPMNSAMNPILYSKFIGRQASRAKEWINQNFFRI